MRRQEILVARHSARRKLERAYRGTSFEVDHPDGKIVIRIGKTNDRLDAQLRQRGEKYWAYVTACNPRSVRLPAAVNSQRQSDFRAYLLSMGFTIYPGQGMPAKPGWEPEPSFLIVGITRDQATRIGVMLEQNAVVVGTLGGRAALKFCKLPKLKKRYHQLTGPDALAIEHYIEEHVETLWENAEVTGVWIRESDVPRRIIPESAGLLKGKVSSRRIGKLEGGAKPIAKEFQLWRKAWIKSALEDQEDADIVPGFAISRVNLPGYETVYALILATGYSFTDIERWLEGVFPSMEGAIQHMSDDGWHSY
jgi:hypothetical protein